MAPRLRRTPNAARRVLPLVAAAAVTLSACGVDPGVVTVGAAPQRPVADLPAAADTTAPPVATTTPDPGTTAPPPAPPATTAPATTSPATTAPPTPETSPPTTEPPAPVEADIEIGDVVDVGADKPARDYDSFVAAAFTDIERWWGEVYPVVFGEPFVPLQGGVYAGYRWRESPLPGCGEPTTQYEDLNLYVAFYCEFDDFIIYDDGDESLLTALAAEFGAAVMGIVLAHEYGHVIQNRVGALDEALPTILTEQQADCFAGSWTGQAYRGESPLLDLGDRDVRAGLIAMLSVRDPVGTDQFVPGGHGSAFDRVGAFQVGFGEGPARCSLLLDDPLPLVPNAFRPGSVDEALGGNASYDCTDLVFELDTCTPAPEFLATDLNDFWSTELGSDFTPLTPQPVDDLSAVECADTVALTDEIVLCPDDNIVVYDEPVVADLYREFGDFTLGYLYGIAWAEAAQRVSGSTLAGEDRALLQDCLTGAWVVDIVPDESGQSTRETSTVFASPGDFDEAIRMAIVVGDDGADVDLVGTPFEKIESFRVGVLGGVDACDTLAEG